MEKVTKCVLTIADGKEVEIDSLHLKELNMALQSAAAYTESEDVERLFSFVVVEYLSEELAAAEKIEIEAAYDKYASGWIGGAK